MDARLKTRLVGYGAMGLLLLSLGLTLAGYPPLLLIGTYGVGAVLYVIYLVRKSRAERE
jgi:hypothetical protein